MSTTAKIADESYKRENNRREDIDGYEYIDTLSNDSLAVYRKGDDYILSSRGTSFNKDRIGKDIAADLDILKGTEKHSRIIQQRVRDIKSVIKQIKKDNPESTIELTGHSLGGNVVIQALNDPEINDSVDKVITYNPGTSPLSGKFTGDSSKIENHIVKGDPIAQFKVPGETIEYTSVNQDLSLPEIGLSIFGSGFTASQLQKHSMGIFTTPGKVQVTQPETGKTTSKVIGEFEEVQEAKKLIKVGKKVGEGLTKVGRAAQKVKRVARVGKKIAKVGETIAKGTEVVEGAANPVFDAIMLADWGVSKIQRAKNAKRVLDLLINTGRADLEEHNAQPFLSRSIRIQLFGEFLAEAKETINESDPNSDEYKQAKFLVENPGVFWNFASDFADNSSAGSRAEIVGLQLGSSHRWNQFLKENTLADMQKTVPEVITREELDREQAVRRTEIAQIKKEEELHKIEQEHRVDFGGHRNVLNVQSETDKEWLKGHPSYEYSKNVLGLGVHQAEAKESWETQYYINRNK